MLLSESDLETYKQSLRNGASRTRMVEAIVEEVRELLPRNHVGELRFGVALLEAFLERCDGSETIDKTTIDGLIGDVKALIATGNPEPFLPETAEFLMVLRTYVPEPEE